MEKILQKALPYLLILLLHAGSGYSQTVPGDSLKSMLVKDWERAKAYTEEYMNAMPDNQYSYRPDDSIRTFAQQLLHLAQATNFFVMTATGDKPPFGGRDLEKVPLAQSADSVRYYVDKSYDFALTAIKNFSPARYMELASITMGQTYAFTRFNWLLKAFEHQTHHRGQSTIYLRTAGIKPPRKNCFNQLKWQRD